MSTPSVPVGLKKAATLCILRSYKGLLLLRRSKEPHLGKYIPIGGRLDPFETPAQASIREVYEETNISLAGVSLVGIMTETSPTKFNWINYIYVSDIDPEIHFVQSDEGTLEWIEISRLDTIPTPTTDRYIYEYVARGKFFVFDAVYDENVELVELLDALSGQDLLESPK